MKIEKRIRLLRHQHGWNLQHVAQQLGLSIPALSKIENGATDLTLSRLEQFGRLFGLSVIQLLTDNENVLHERNQLNSKNKILMDRHEELIGLQDKAIQLYEELRQISKAG